MKKLVSVLSLILLSFMMFACDKTPTISYRYSSVTINYDEGYLIDDSLVSIFNSKSGYDIVVLDGEVATVDGHLISPCKSGNTIVRLQLIDNESIFFDIALNVTNINYATFANVNDGDVVLNVLDMQSGFKKVSVDDNCNEEPIITFDDSVIDYDYITGIITPKAVGETSVVISFKKCCVSFRVSVVGTIYTTLIEVDSSQNVFANGSGKLVFDIFPNNSNTYKFYCENENFVVNNDGTYQSTIVGNYTVYYEYQPSLISNKKSGYFTVNVIEKITQFDVDVVDMSNCTVSYCTIYDNYRIRVYIDGNMPIEKLDWDKKVFQTVTDWQYQDGYFYATIIFKKRTTNNILLTYKFDENEQSWISSNIELGVYDITDVTVVGRYYIYELEPLDDGGYYIYTEDAYIQNSFNVILMINEFRVYDGFKLYDMTNGSKILINNEITSQEPQNMVIAVEYQGAIIDYINLEIKSSSILG